MQLNQKRNLALKAIVKIPVKTVINMCYKSF